MSCELQFQLSTCTDKFFKDACPLLSKQICAGQTTISANTDKISDPMFNKVECCFHTTFARSEVLASGTADNCSTLDYNVAIFALFRAQCNAIKKIN